MSETKFLHIVAKRETELIESPIMKPGFYNWHKAFNGDVAHFEAVKNRLHEYDIIFVALSTPEVKARFCNRVRGILGDNSDTKLIVTVDHAIEAWDRAWDLFGFIDELKAADLIFSPIHIACKWLDILTDYERPVMHLRHPVDVDAISSAAVPDDKRTDEILCLIHTYDRNWLPPYLVTKPYREKVNTIFLAESWGMIDEICGLHPQAAQGWTYSMDEETEKVRHRKSFVKWMARHKVIIDSYEYIHSMGRVQIDGACLGIPVIGSANVEAQADLWPDLTTEPGDVGEQRELLCRLLTDSDFYQHCVDKAWGRVQDYSYDTITARLLEILSLTPEPEVADA